MTIKDARLIERTITANANALCDAVDRLNAQLSNRNDLIAIREAEIKRLDKRLMEIRVARQWPTPGPQDEPVEHVREG